MNGECSTRSGDADRPIETPAEGQQLLDHTAEVMTALLQLVEEESDLLRAGRVRQAASLEPRKAELTGLYVAAVARIKSNADFLNRHLSAPLANVREQHARLSGSLQSNLNVLATAHAVSESIIRGVADNLASKSAPTIYGRSGRTKAPRAGAAAPVALSRTL